MNFNKSSTSFSPNTSQELSNGLCEFIGMPLLSKSIKYLGLPTILVRSKMEAYNFLLEKPFLSSKVGTKTIESGREGGDDQIRCSGNSILCHGLIPPSQEVL